MVPTLPGRRLALRGCLSSIIESAVTKPALDCILWVSILWCLAPRQALWVSPRLMSPVYMTPGREPRSKACPGPPCCCAQGHNFQPSVPRELTLQEQTEGELADKRPQSPCWPQLGPRGYQFLGSSRSEMPSPGLTTGPREDGPLPSPEGGPLPSAPLLPSHSFPIPSRSPSRHPARPPGPLPGAVHKVSGLSDRKAANLKML